jgi:hypothetical protein
MDGRQVMVSLKERDSQAILALVKVHLMIPHQNQIVNLLKEAETTSKKNFALTSIPKVLYGFKETSCKTAQA